MNFNLAFIANIKSIYGKKGEDWLLQLPMQIDRICKRRGLRFIKVITNLTYNFVGIFEEIETTEKVILKLSPESERLSLEYQWLQCFSNGVPKANWFDRDACALSMELIEPGYSLKNIVEQGNDDLATKILCQVILNLQRHQHKKFEFKPISDLAQTLKVLESKIDHKVISKAIGLFLDLSEDRANDVVLHGDLHHDNILADGSGWKAIDPHAYIGDPAFEVGSMIHNPYDSFPTQRTTAQTVDRRLRILREELPFDAERIKGWAFCKTILSVAWTFEDHAKIDEEELEIAKIIDRVRL